MGLESHTLAEDPWVECFWFDALLSCRLSLSSCWEKDLLILVPGNTEVFSVRTLKRKQRSQNNIVSQRTPIPKVR